MVVTKILEQHYSFWRNILLKKSHKYQRHNSKIEIFIIRRATALEFSLPLLIPEFSFRSLGNRLRNLMGHVLLEYTFLRVVDLPLSVIIPTMLHSRAN